MLAAVPALAGASGPAPVARHTQAVSARPAHPGPAHRHRDAVKRVPATVNANSKRDGGHPALPAPAAGVVPTAHPAAIGTAAATSVGGGGSTLAARAPPARQ